MRGTSAEAAARIPGIGRRWRNWLGFQQGTATRCITW